MTKNGAPTGSPNADPGNVNALVRHRIVASGVERPRLRQRQVKPELTLPECGCPKRPRATEDTYVLRHACQCGRHWEWRYEDAAWKRVR